MHIAFLTSEYPPLPSGGIGTSIQNLSRELVKQGHRVTVLGWGKKTEFEDHGVRVRFLEATRIPKMGWLINRIFAAHELNRMVHEEGLDIVEAPDWLGLSAGMKLDCPLVIRCNGSDTYFGSLLGYKPRWSIYQAEKMSLHQAQGVVSVSSFTAEITQKLFHLKKTIGVIPNGINLSQFSFDNSIQEEKSLILYFGTLVRKKGVLELAEIFSKVLSRNPSARLLLVGRDSIDRQTGISTWTLFQRKLNPSSLKRIEYVGSKQPDEIASFIRLATVCVFPSFAETFGLAWIEAMACGKAVVASNIGWAKEIIEDGVSGILIHPTDHLAYADEICDLLANPEKRRLMGQKARNRVEQLFSIQRIAELSLEWYKEMINAQN